MLFIVLLLFQKISELDQNPNDQYGIIDPNSLKIIVNPSDWTAGNQKEIKKLLGYTPPFIVSDDNFYFCCFDTNPKAIEIIYDDQLNKIYQITLKKLNSEEQEKLRLAQRQWLKFRALDCNWAYGPYHLDCLIAHTSQRVLELSIANDIIYIPPAHE